MNVKSFCSTSFVGNEAGRGKLPSRYTTASGGCVERTPAFVTISYRFAWTGAERDFGSSTRPSTIAPAKSEAGTTHKIAFSHSNPCRRIACLFNRALTQRKVSDAAGLTILVLFLRFSHGHRR